MMVQKSTRGRDILSSYWTGSKYQVPMDIINVSSPKRSDHGLGEDSSMSPYRPDSLGRWQGSLWKLLVIYIP